MSVSDKVDELTWCIDIFEDALSKENDVLIPAREAVSLLREYRAKLEAEAKAEPVAIIGPDYRLLWCRVNWSEGIKVGDALYNHPPKTSADAGQAPVVSELFINTIAVDIEQAMLRAFNFGQTYWQQADSESIRQQTKSDETKKKFDEVVLNVKSEICSSIAKLGQSVPDGWMRDLEKVKGLAEHLESIGWRANHKGDVDCYDQGSAMAADVIRKILIPLITAAPTQEKEG